MTIKIVRKKKKVKATILTEVRLLASQWPIIEIIRLLSKIINWECPAMTPLGKST